MICHHLQSHHSVSFKFGPAIPERDVKDNSFLSLSLFLCHPDSRLNGFPSICYTSFICSALYFFAKRQNFFSTYHILSCLFHSNYSLIMNSSLLKDQTVTCIYLLVVSSFCLFSLPERSFNVTDSDVLVSIIGTGDR